MGFNKENYARIKQEYDGKYLRAQEAARLRRAEIHAKLPEVAKIDAELSATGARIFEASLRGDKAALDTINAENAKLNEKRGQIMVSAGYPADYTEIKYECAACGDSYQDSIVDPEKYSQLPPSQSGEVMHFFDDAAFIGDSVALKLQHYQAEYGSFGSATFFTTVSYSVNHAVNNTLFLIYQGREMTPEDALAACGAKKVFIQLGMNDIALVGIDKTIENWGVMLGRIREKNPDIEVYIQSGTPIYIGGEKGGLNNPNMDRYNERLKVFAEENGCHYIDIATVMKNEQGGLKAEFSLDKYVHVNYTACDAWAMVLKEYVGE